MCNIIKQRCWKTAFVEISHFTNSQTNDIIIYNSIHVWVKLSIPDHVQNAGNPAYIIFEPLCLLCKLMLSNSCIKRLTTSKQKPQ